MLISLEIVDIEMNKLLLMPFFVLSTLIPNSVYANSERRQFVNVCSNELVGVYANRTANKICDCAYDYWKAGGDPATGGYLCALEHGNF